VLRLTLASAVIVSHAYPLEGHESREFMFRFSRGQVTLGDIAVCGFFVISGFLVTRSALTSSTWRYAWKRFIRIFPGFWACLLVTAFVFAPLMWLYEHGARGGFFTHRDGPVSYLTRNAFTGIQQYGISGLLAGTPYGRQTGVGVFDGSLWTLVYEVACYVALAFGAATILKRRPRATVTVAAAILFYSVDVVRQHTTHRVLSPPLIGPVFPYWLVIFGLCFALGALFEVFRTAIPVHVVLAAVAAVVLTVSLRSGDYFLVGLPALAYLLMWAAVSLPKATRRIGRRNDYSYGVYIYAFPVQMMLVELRIDGPFVVYCMEAFVLTGLLAFASWHLVEKRAMALRHVGLRPAAARIPARRNEDALDVQGTLLPDPPRSGA